MALVHAAGQRLWARSKPRPMDELVSARRLGGWTAVVMVPAALVVAFAGDAAREAYYWVDSTRIVVVYLGVLVLSPMIFGWPLALRSLDVLIADRRPQPAATTGDRCTECGLHLAAQTWAAPKPLLGGGWLLSCACLAFAMAAIGLLTGLYASHVATWNPRPGPLGHAAYSGTIPFSAIQADAATSPVSARLAASTAMIGGVATAPPPGALAATQVVWFSGGADFSEWTIGWPVAWLVIDSQEFFTDMTRTERVGGADPGLAWGFGTSPTTRQYTWLTDPAGFSWRQVSVDYGALAIAALCLLAAWRVLVLALCAWPRILATSRRRRGLCVLCGHTLWDVRAALGANTKEA